MKTDKNKIKLYADGPNLGEINKLKDDYFKLSEQVKLVTQYHENVNKTLENTNRVNNNLHQISKNSAEKRLLFSEINQLVNSDPMDQEALDEKIKEYLSLGEESTRLREKVDEIRESPQVDYMIVKEPSIAVRKLKAGDFIRIFELIENNKSEQISFIIHKIKRKQTLSDISSIYGVSENLILKYNIEINIKRNNILKIPIEKVRINK